jgi:hypothetical protein
MCDVYIALAVNTDVKKKRTTRNVFLVQAHVILHNNSMGGGGGICISLPKLIKGKIKIQ